MSSIYIHHTCILIYDFSLIALMGNSQPCLLHTRCLATFALLAFDISADIIFIFFLLLSQCEMCNSVFSGPRLKDMKNIQVCAERLQELRPTQDSKLYMSFYKAAGCRNSVYVKGVGGGRGGKETMCATPKVCTRKNIPKIIIRLLILPAIP